ncbi:MAG TPA: hypothetical protein VM577_19170 [Anaerovoracaceae bacterium]|nr:hypothetical protein [Anaerovoracaceae bacterium]
MKQLTEEALACLHFDWEGNEGARMLRVMLELRGKVPERAVKSSDFDKFAEAIDRSEFHVMNYIFRAITLFQYLCSNPESFVKWCLEEDMIESKALATCGLIHMFGRAESLSSFNNGSWYMSLKNLNLVTKGQHIYFFVMYFLISNYEKYEDDLMLDERGGDGVQMANYKIYNILHASQDLLSDTIGRYLEEMKKVKSMCVLLLENKVVAKTFLELAGAYAKAKGKQSLEHYFGQFVTYPEDSLGMTGEALAKQTLAGK